MRWDGIGWGRVGWGGWDASGRAGPGRERGGGDTEIRRRGGGGSTGLSENSGSYCTYNSGQTNNSEHDGSSADEQQPKTPTTGPATADRLDVRRVTVRG